MTKQQAIKASIRHWVKMIKWVREQDPLATKDYAVMHTAIHDDWFCCPLCKWAKDMCVMNCPIVKKCNDPGSTWHKFATCHTWDDWLHVAYRMHYELVQLLNV